MFPNGVGGCQRSPNFSAGERVEYVKLIVKHWRNGQCGLRSYVHASAPIFAVSKPGKEKQRVIWNGSELSRRAALPPKPPLLISPTSLAHLEASHGSPVWVS